MKLQHLFVYGTLAPGEPNAHVLSTVEGNWQRGHVRGYLHKHGWGATQGYPGIRLDDNGDIVDGWLFSSYQLQAHWQRLDKFEGNDYERVEVEVHLADLKTIKAQIYQVVHKK